MPGRKPELKPTDSELEILRIIWRNGPSTVRDINDELNRNRKVGYTTTLKLMQIMFEKGLLDRKEDGRHHIYSPVIREEETKKLLLDRFVENAFGGSAMQLVMQALGKHEATREELEELKKLIRKIEKKKE